MPESATATIDQKLIAIRPPTLSELWRTTNSGPRMPRRMWPFSQFRSGPRPRRSLMRFRAEYRCMTVIITSPAMPNCRPRDPPGFSVQ